MQHVEVVDRDVEGGTLNFVPGVEVGEVEGSVQNSKGDPLPRARVNLIAYGDHANRVDLNRVGFTNEKGEFKIKDVPLGDYKVFAWEACPRVRQKIRSFASRLRSKRRQSVCSLTAMRKYR